jgi:hypothetical protein
MIAWFFEPPSLVHAFLHRVEENEGDDFLELHVVSETGPYSVAAAFTSNVTCITDFGNCSFRLGGQGNDRALLSPTFLTLSVEATSAVPIPPALPLFATGLAALGLLARRRKKQAA